MKTEICYRLIAFITLLSIISSQTTITGTTTTASLNTHAPYTFVGGGGGTINTVQATLTFTGGSPVVTQVMLFVRTNPTAPSGNDLNINYYDHKNPTSYTTFDLHGSNIGKKQIINVGGLVTGNTIYIWVVNFNPLESTSYSIVINERVGINSFCAPGSTPSASSIYCSSCSNSLQSGPFCDLNNPNMASNVSYSLTLYPYGDPQGNFGTMTIPASDSQITLQYTASHTNIVNAIQFKYFGTEVAGIMNAAVSGLRLLNQLNTQYSININSGGKNDVSVSFLNRNSNPVTINVWYTVKSSSNALIIVLSVLGGILFIGLVVVAVCIIRRMRSNEQAQVSPMSLLMVRAGSMRVNNQNDLNAQQIQTYFPSVLCKNVLNEQQHSSNNLTNAAEKDVTGDRDCVICLCPVQSTQMIKITYCRHIFHAQCLNKWFEKQRNCPYCREEYNKKSTIQHYQTLLGICHKNILAGIDLAREIMISKPIKSSLVIEEIKE